MRLCAGTQRAVCSEASPFLENPLPVVDALQGSGDAADLLEAGPGEQSQQTLNGRQDLEPRRPYSTGSALVRAGSLRVA